MVTLDKKAVQDGFEGRTSEGAPMKPIALILVEAHKSFIQEQLEEFGYAVTREIGPTVSLVLFDDSQTEVAARFDCPQILLGPHREGTAFCFGPEGQAQEFRSLLQEIQKSSQNPLLEVRRLRRALTEQHRTRENFLALLSHELRTPLTLVLGNLHILKKIHGKARDESTMAMDCVLAAMEGGRRLQLRIQEMLHLTTGDRSPVERWDISKTLSTLRDEMEPLARGRSVELDWENPSVTVEGRPRRLREALHHILKNAILFNRFGGRVRLRSRQQETHWHLEVADEGRGMSPIELERIFEPFYQAEEANTRTVEGLGVGLTLARRTIEAHSGELSIDSTLGKGTTVTVKLPLIQGSPVHEVSPAPPEAPAASPVGGEALVDYAREVYQLYQEEREQRLQAEEHQRMTESTLIGTLVTLVRRIDPRGDLNLDQSERVLEYAKAVARRLDPTLLSKPDFTYALLLYDIGKIGVTESVLLKSGKLDAPERAKAEAHPVIGAQILASVRSLHPAIDAVRHHHERWDGSGYPEGLSGTDIPILARLIAVVDSFDAMTVDRPYRKAMALEEARGELDKLAGKQFDPKIVGSFHQAWEEILLIANRAGAGRPPSEPEPSATA